MEKECRNLERFPKTVVQETAATENAREFRKGLTQVTKTTTLGIQSVTAMAQ